MALPQPILCHGDVRDFSVSFSVITGMNPKASFGNLLRSKLRDIIPCFAGQFDQQTSEHFVFEVWVSLPSAARDC